jgi:Flp pilus assembly pilin Flp
MPTFLEKLWRDERGCVPATEWMLVASILTLGAIAGLLALHHPGDWLAVLTR